MNWRCKLKHPFEWGLYIEETTKTMSDGEKIPWKILRCKYCDYVYDSDKTGKPNLDWLWRDKNQ